MGITYFFFERNFLPTEILTLFFKKTIIFKFYLESTPYEGGCFRVKLVLGADFPAAPPKCKFLTIDKCDVYTLMRICLFKFFFLKKKIPVILLQKYLIQTFQNLFKY